jgi:hypothetical protein
VSAPASSNSTFALERADSRFASTHPAAPPPMMMVSKVSVMGGRELTLVRRGAEEPCMTGRGTLHQHCTTKHARKQSIILVARALRGIPPDVRFIAVPGEGGQADNG